MVTITKEQYFEIVNKTKFNKIVESCGKQLSIDINNIMKSKLLKYLNNNYF